MQGRLYSNSMQSTSSNFWPKLSLFGDKNHSPSLCLWTVQTVLSLIALLGNIGNFISGSWFGDTVFGGSDYVKDYTYSFSLLFAQGTSTLFSAERNRLYSVKAQAHSLLSLSTHLPWLPPDGFQPLVFSSRREEWQLNTVCTLLPLVTLVMQGTTPGWLARR